MKRILKPLLILAAFVTVALIFYPLIAQPPYPRDPKTPELSSLKHLAIGTLYYCADNDDRFPIATQMPGIRATLIPYVKNADAFKEIPKRSDPKEFNFNYAGAKTDAVPSGYASLPPVDETTVWYCVSTLKDRPGGFHSRIDTSVKFVPLATLFATFKYQYTRAENALAPAGYLTDQDPLTEQVK